MVRRGGCDFDRDLLVGLNVVRSVNVELLWQVYCILIGLEIT